MIESKNKEDQVSQIASPNHPNQRKLLRNKNFLPNQTKKWKPMFGRREKNDAPSRGDRERESQIEGEKEKGKLWRVAGKTKKCTLSHSCSDSKGHASAPAPDSLSLSFSSFKSVSPQLSLLDS